MQTPSESNSLHVKGKTPTSGLNILWLEWTE